MFVKANLANSKSHYMITCSQIMGAADAEVRNAYVLYSEEGPVNLGAGVGVRAGLSIFKMSE